MSLVLNRRRSASWGFLLLGLLAVTVNRPAHAFAFASGFGDTPSTCSAAGWTSFSAGAVFGGPATATPVVRYAGACAFRAPGTGSVLSDHPGSESVYRARFYVFPQAVNGAVAIFQASDAGTNPVRQFSLVHDAMANAFLVFVGLQVSGTPHAVVGGVQPFRWYSIELLHQTGQKLAISVQGAGTAAAINAVTVVTVPGTIGSASLGWLGTSTGNPTGAYNFDAFASNNSTTPFGRLCRGDADANGVRDAPDYKDVTGEILKRSLAPGQPDCNEDGKIDAADRVCIAKAIGGACP